MGDNDEKKVLKSDIIEASLLLDSGLFDDEPEEVIETNGLKEQETGAAEENPESSSEDAMGIGFSVAIDDERTVSDTRKAQLEVIEYFLRNEQIPRTDGIGTKEKPKASVKPNASAARSLNGKGKKQRNTMEEDLQIPTSEKSGMQFKSFGIIEKVSKKHQAAVIEKAPPKVKVKPRHELKVKKSSSVQNKHPVGSMTTNNTMPKVKSASDRSKGLMSMKIMDREAGVEIKSMMDLEMDMNADLEGMKEYFRR
jgi:hypothetical protein